MNLDFFNDLANRIEKNDGVKSFLNELQNFLSNIKIEGNEIGKENTNLLDRIKNNRNVSMISENRINNAKDEILEDYSCKEAQGEPIYFIADRVGDYYRIEKYENGIRENMKLSKDDLLNQANINMIMKEEAGKYVIDPIATNHIMEKLKEKVNEILEEQDTKLQKYRKEGHLYTITEDKNNRIFLWDITEKPETEIEEVNFPNELRGSVSEGTTLLYENGKYTIKEGT